MSWFDKVLWKLSNILYAIAGVVLTLMMCLTTTDVILRYLGRPIRGTYELVGLSAALVIGFAIPYTSLIRGHVYVEFLIERLDEAHRSVVLVFTKILILLLFVAFGINLFRIGLSWSETGEVTQILRIPFYPVAYGVGVCCFIECLVMVSDIVKLVGGEYE